MASRDLNRKRVLCLEESAWSNRLSDQTSVLPALELLHRMKVVDEFVHRHAFGRDEFDRYLTERMHDRRVRSYGTIFFAFHGSERGLSVDGQTLPLNYLADSLGEIPGSVVHLGSCSTLRGGQQAAKDFLRVTRAKALTGYDRDVEWLDAAALDVAWLGYIAEYKEVGTALRHFRSRYASLIKHLGWDAVVR